MKKIRRFICRLHFSVIKSCSGVCVQKSQYLRQSKDKVMKCPQETSTTEIFH